MGWDAFARGPKGGININSDAANDFKYKALQVKRNIGSADCLLETGALDCSNCAEMIERACGLSPWTEELWNPRNMQWDWNFKYKDEDAWAYHSAKVFIETCIEHDLTIRFSF
jgi:hypothetical protein